MRLKIETGVIASKTQYRFLSLSLSLTLTHTLKPSHFLLCRRHNDQFFRPGTFFFDTLCKKITKLFFTLPLDKPSSNFLALHKLKLPRLSPSRILPKPSRSLNHAIRIHPIVIVSSIHIERVCQLHDVKMTRHGLLHKGLTSAY